MSVFRVKFVTCPSCSYRFSPKNSGGKTVKAPLAVIEALQGNEQTCPSCGARFDKGALLTQEDRKRLTELKAKKAKPKRRSTCSLCGKTGHTKRDCPQSYARSGLDADDLLPDYEEGLSNEDLGLCPHGCSDDEGCDEPGCLGGPEGFDADYA